MHIINCTRFSLAMAPTASPLNPSQYSAYVGVVIVALCKFLMTIDDTLSEADPEIFVRRPVLPLPFSSSPFLLPLPPLSPALPLKVDPFKCSQKATGGNDFEYSEYHILRV